MSTKALPDTRWADSRAGEWGKKERRMDGFNKGSLKEQERLGLKFLPSDSQNK